MLNTNTYREAVCTFISKVTPKAEHINRTLTLTIIRTDNDVNKRLRKF